MLLGAVGAGRSPPETFDARHLYVFGRFDAANRLAAVLNDDTVSHIVTVPVRQLSVPNDTRMTNLLTGRPYTVKDGGVVVKVAGRDGAILAQ